MHINSRLLSNKIAAAVLFIYILEKNAIFTYLNLDLYVCDISDACLSATSFSNQHGRNTEPWRHPVEGVPVTSSSHWAVTSSSGGVFRDVITLSRDVYGYMAVYTCDIGSVFTEGGYARTSVCTEGQWTPDSLPGCHGNRVDYIAFRRIRVVLR